MTAGKPPAEKLPLALRKNVRDDYESRIPEWEKELSTTLKMPWKLDINPLAIWPYAQKGEFGYDNIGTCIASYVTAAISRIKGTYQNEQGQSGIAELNRVCAAHILTLSADKVEYPYSSCDIKDGQLRILFDYEHLGSSIDNALLKLDAAVSAAPQPSSGSPSISYAARHSIEQYYAPHIGALQERAATQLHNPSVEFAPDWEGIAAMLKDGKGVDKGWEELFGDFVLRYFTSVVDQMKREGFEKDDMLQEGFAEAVPKGVIKMRVVDKIGKDYNEMVIEDGCLVLQTVPGNWGTLIDNIGEKLVDLL